MGAQPSQYPQGSIQIVLDKGAYYQGENVTGKILLSIDKPFPGSKAKKLQHGLEKTISLIVVIQLFYPINSWFTTFHKPSTKLGNIPSHFLCDCLYKSLLPLQLAQSSTWLQSTKSKQFLFQKIHR